MQTVTPPNQPASYTWVDANQEDQNAYRTTGGILDFAVLVDNEGYNKDKRYADRDEHSTGINFKSQVNIRCVEGTERLFGARGHWFNKPERIKTNKRNIYRLQVGDDHKKVMNFQNKLENNHYHNRTLYQIISFNSNEKFHRKTTAFAKTTEIKLSFLIAEIDHVIGGYFIDFKTPRF